MINRASLIRNKQQYLTPLVTKDTVIEIQVLQSDIKACSTRQTPIGNKCFVITCVKTERNVMVPHFFNAGPQLSKAHR
ncbi:hypothetical protein CHQ57_17620 [Aeromonas salmonicida]|nr:hypothetical protein CHQ57_17620 [Aeromonas salmonicida]